MTAKSKSLTPDFLQRAVAGDGAAFRLRTRLQPAGGPGDKVFPPTYLDGQDGKEHSSRYATETRVIDGERKPSVLLDSVAAQANRMELALLEARRRGEIRLPLVAIDFEATFPDLGRISALEAPHRVYDAILRDSTLDGTAFRSSEVGRRLTESSTADARAMFDPLQISASVRIDIPKDNSDKWTVDEKGKSKQRPSEVNHSNIAPTRNEEAGGVTFEYALHTAVFSLPALRRIRFGSWDSDRSNAARTMLAALGILALLLQRREGYDFRSRCSLVPEAPASLEYVDANGTTQQLGTSVDEARELYEQALVQAKKAKATWVDKDVVLRPMPKLVQLIKASREALRAGTTAD